MAMIAEYRSKFEALHRYFIYMTEKFSEWDVKPQTNKQII